VAESVGRILAGLYRPCIRMDVLLKAGGLGQRAFLTKQLKFSRPSERSFALSHFDSTSILLDDLGVCPEKVRLSLSRAI
jgi:hypothetical protein